MNRSRHEFGADSRKDRSSISEPIAIVGAACRLPGAPNLDAFRELLLNGVDAVTEIPDDRWNKAALYHPQRGQKGKSYTFAAGVLDEVKSFDAAFFGMSPREAEQTDPQQRLALELAYEAMEDAGIDAGKLAGEKVGVFVGASSWDYTTLHSSDPASMDAYSMTGATLCSIANRISYMFDLHGPSFTVDTACSSSLVALHQACEAIRAGTIPMAMVGGVSLLLTPQSFVGFSAASMLSPRGRCHAFDHRADGYVRAEGGGFIFLKPLGQALVDGDPIRAVIRGTGVNSDGRTTGFSLPNKAAQMAILEEVYGRFELDPEELIYIEAHGTGTPAGDPIEAGALGAILGKRRKAKLPIGSVKTNIGHLEAGSGMAGLMKAIVVAEGGIIPPSLNLEAPNPNIPFDDLNLELVPGARPVNGNGSLIGINSFGFGGTNSHAVLERAPIREFVLDEEADAPLPPLLLSAQTEGALTAMAARWSDLVRTSEAGALPGLLRSVALTRQQMKRRLVIPAENQDELAAALDTLARGDKGGLAQTDTAVSGKIAFVFSGNGSQWAGMAQDAMAHSEQFREALLDIDDVLQPELGWSVIEALTEPDADTLRETAIAQPLLFAIQVALVTALRVNGLDGEAFMGHSVGEVAAAWAAGALNLEQAVRVIAARSRAQQTLHGQGGMAVVGLDPQATVQAIGNRLSVAAHNSAGGTTIAGALADLDTFEGEAKAQGWRFTRLDLDYAFHSPIMEPIKPKLLGALGGLTGNGSNDRFVSTVSGGVLDGGALDADYWWLNVRQPVLFAEAARGLVERGFRIFVEIGPHPVVRAYLIEALRAVDVEGRVLPTLQRRPASHDPIKAIAAKAHAAGADIRISNDFYGPVTPRRLPPYAWQRETFWLGRTSEAADRFILSHEHPLLGIRQSDDADEWRQHLGLETHPWIVDHQIGGTAVFPAAALIDMGLAAARARHPDTPAIELLEVEIGRALVLEPGVMREVALRIDATGTFQIASRPRLAEDGWTVHVKGRATSLDVVAPADLAKALPIAAHIDSPTLYALARDMGLEYGPAFRAVTGIDLSGQDSGVTALSPTGLLGKGFLLSPDLLDGALQGLLALAAEKLGSGSGVMPWRFGRIRLRRDLVAAPVAAQMEVTRIGPRSVRADLHLVDAEGRIFAEMVDCWFVRVALTSALDDREMSFHPVMKLAPSLLPEPAIAVALPSPIEHGAAEEPSEMALLVDAFASTAAFHALLPLADETDAIDPLALVQRATVSRASLPLLHTLLGWLEQDGLASQDVGRWTLATIDDLPTPAHILQTLLAEAPDAVAEIALLASAAEDLPRRLTEGPNACAAPAAALVDQIRYHSPSGRAAVNALIEAVVEAAECWPTDHVLRILEIGARRGGLTRRLIGALDTRACELTALTSADDLPVLTAALGSVPFTRAVAASSDLQGQKFDLILGLDVAEEAAALSLTELAAYGTVLILADPDGDRFGTLVTSERTKSDLPDVAACGAGAPMIRYVREGLLQSRLLAMPLASTAVIRGGATASLLVAEPNNALAAEIVDKLIGKMAIERCTPADLSVRSGLLDTPLILLVDDLTPTLPGRLSAIAALAGLAPEEGSLPLTLIANRKASGSPETAAIMGVRRVLANEAPTFASRLICLGENGEGIVDALVAEILNGSDEQEVWLDGRERRVGRVHSGLPTTQARDSKALKLAINRPGLLDSLGWTTARPAKPGPGELAIEVKAAGLNFRDVMWAMGLLPDEALLDGFAGPTLGLECAGVVTSIGRNVAGFSPGDRVMAFAPASLSTHTVTAAHAVMRMPEGMDYAAAATVPVAFLTVAYSVGYLARLDEGETILIHGGAGGVGLAAIQYAKLKGATVFATAGSPAKRALLKNLGIDAVLDSRSLGFADEVLRLTGGEGVDVVLNSLAGEAMRRSLALVKPFGRFLELGKRDFYENSEIGLRPFRHNVTYFGIDADQLPLKRPALAAELFAEISELMTTGQLRPLPFRMYDYRESEAAFRLMQGAGHIGKIVLAPSDRLPTALPEAAALRLSDGPYVVTGGLSGFGLEAAKWLGRQGARKLALLGRRGINTPGAREAIAALANAGIEAQAIAVDITDEPALAATLNTIRKQQGAIRGVVHAAVAMDDALLSQLDIDRFAAALAPKLGGADALDRLTRSDPIDLFLLFSSVTTPMGNPGQGNYVAANAAIEAIAERRHAEGLPGLAIQWGPIGDAGYLARENGVSDMLSRQIGSAHLTAAQALDRIPMLLESGLPVAGFATVRWAGLRKSLPLIRSSLFADMRLGTQYEAGDVDLRELLATCTPQEAREKATAMLIEEVARIMKLAPERIEAQRPLTELGMDSLMAVELRLAVEQRFGVTIPVLALSEGATLAIMAGRILRSLSGCEETPSTDESAQMLERLSRHESGTIAANDTSGDAIGSKARSIVPVVATLP